MMEIIKDLPDDTVGIISRGKITAKEYEAVIIPAFEEKFKTHDKLNALFVMEDYEGVELAALWDDACFGIKHWSGFKRLALVTDMDWAKSAAAFVAWMIPAEVRVFTMSEIDQARNWVAGLPLEDAA
ncbi:MAG: STAS/SEC14 domain-containing protein [Alphaproteobacteria bacterium]|nr:STAS/SEC14 domain-containing protein [Alphaproteobacteria bacterium]